MAVEEAVPEESESEDEDGDEEEFVQDHPMVELSSVPLRDFCHVQVSVESEIQIHIAPENVEEQLAYYQNEEEEEDEYQDCNEQTA